MNGGLQVDGMYVVHGITGYEEREKSVNKLLRDENEFDFEFVKESEDPEQNKSWIDKYFVTDIRQKLSRGAIFCTLVHIRCYEKIVASNDQLAIIFENDICFLGDFKKKMQPILEEAKQLPEGFMVSLENSTLRFPSFKKTKKGKCLYEADFGRCAGAYLIDQKGAQAILNHVKEYKCDKVIDWWHNDLIKEGVLKMYWAHPPVAEQGSMNGRLPSTISSRSRGNWRSVKWNLQKFYKMRILRLLR